MVVNVLKPVLFRGADKGLAIAEVLQVVVVVQVHISGGCFGKHELTFSSAGIGLKQIQLILKSIEANKCELVWILGPVQARQVLICFRTRIHFLHFFGGEVYHMD